jgi:hypothetical protein
MPDLLLVPDVALELRQRDLVRNLYLGFPSGATFIEVFLHASLTKTALWFTAGTFAPSA